MKTYSILIICLTLGLFYSLAVHQQNTLNTKELKSFDGTYETYDVNQESDVVPYFFIEDEFSMHVTGKEHRYLNTGISFIEYPEVPMEKECLVAHANEEKTDLSGS